MSESNRVEELRTLRAAMGTTPADRAPKATRFYRGVEGIRVDLVDAPVNPYRAIFVMATATWGSTRSTGRERWERASPLARLEVVRAVLARQALPLALEAPQFVFTVEGLSRWSFDQLARARLGVVFASMGTRDNCHLDAPFRLHETTFRDPRKLAPMVDLCLRAKDVYADVVGLGEGSWQEARTALPISVAHRFEFAINYAALANLCSRRMSFSEAEDTVAVAWLLRERLMYEDAFPLLGAHLRPGCDFARACQYHKAHSMSEAFGCLFRSCGRNPVRSAPGNPTLDYECATFNEVCSDRATIQAQLGIEIPGPDEDRPETFEPALRDRWLLGFPPRSSEEGFRFRGFAEEIGIVFRAFATGPAGLASDGYAPEDLVPVRP